MPILSLEHALTALRDNTESTILVRHSQFNRDIAEIFAELLSRNTTLRILSLTACEINDEILIKLLPGLKACTSLSVLKLSWNAIYNEGAIALAESLQDFVSLDTLYLSGNKIKAAGVEAFAVAIKTRRCHLVVLDLGHNEIRFPRAFQALADSLPGSGLHELYLSNTWMDDEGAGHIANGISKCLTIHTLSLADNRCVTDIGVRKLSGALKAHRSLSRVFTSGTKATTKTRDKLHRLIRTLFSPQATLLTILCSVHHVDSIGRKSHLRLLPKDLLRYLVSMLY